MPEPELIQTKAGTQRTVRSRYGDDRTVVVGREWDVLIDGEKIGTIRYGMITRERKRPGAPYVDRRWESPGWQYKAIGDVGMFSWSEPYKRSRKGAIEQLVRQHERG